MWMAAGFTMLESGSVRTKNASVICLKNVGLYSVAGIAFYLIGYNLMYVDVGSWIGSVRFLYGPSADEIALLGGNAEAEAAVVAKGYAVMSNWFFQMVFVATAASIVSGALAERVKLWSFFAFTLVLTAVIYPIVGAWTWGGGWLRGAAARGRLRRRVRVRVFLAGVDGAGEDGRRPGCRIGSSSSARDVAELGIEAYPEFVLMPEQDDES